jgi:hypothetical protein
VGLCVISYVYSLIHAFITSSDALSGHTVVFLVEVYRLLLLLELMVAGCASIQAVNDLYFATRLGSKANPDSQILSNLWHIQLPFFEAGTHDTIVVLLESAQIVLQQVKFLLELHFSLCLLSFKLVDFILVHLLGLEDLGF